ncbi:MAG: hypothetical protein JEY91_17690, partial [Spirochaetaceae bacterium]|nr:hypothetical protein [Spirochaetaceae bacterium]
MDSNVTVFEQLAATLPADEKKALLQKITKSLKLHESSEDFMRKEIPEKDLERKVRKDIINSNWFERLIIRLYTFFTGRSSIDYFLKRSLKHLKRKLNSISGQSYFELDHKKLSPRLASEIYSLYVLTAPLRKIFKIIWQDADFIENIYASLITETIHTNKSEVYDFVSLEEMESIFASTGEKKQIRKKLINRMNEYLNSIPFKTISEIKEVFHPFYFGKFLVVFPFKNLLNNFGCSIADLVEFRSPDFKVTECSAVIDRIEHFYYALTLFSMIDWSDDCINKIAGTYVRFYEKTDSEGYEDRLQVIRKEINTLNAGVDDFLKKTPLIDIIKYIRNDSYYELEFKIPKPDFFEFYSSTLKLRILSSFSTVFQEVRKQYISTSIERIFLGYKLYQLNGYREYNDFKYKEMGLEYFRHISSLMLLNNFFSQYYKENMVEVFQVLYKTVLIKNPQLQSKILELQKDVEKIKTEIHIFDKTLLPDHEDGKTFSLLKNEIKKSSALERKYKSFITEKDLAAERLIFLGLEILENLRKGLELVI